MLRRVGGGLGGSIAAWREEGSGAIVTSFLEHAWRVAWVRVRGGSGGPHGGCIARGFGGRDG